MSTGMLKEITLSHFRNITQLQFSVPERGYCLITGPNGSGKTSILEAIYFLSCGKSFRTIDNAQLIQNNQERLTVFSVLQNTLDPLSSAVTLASQRDRHGKMIAKYEGEVVKCSEMARRLPTRMISPVEAYTLINGGPEQRRRFLDWGMFHVKHSYWNELQKLQRIVKQKNAALKMRCSDEELMQWNRLMAEVSYTLDRLRYAYVEQLKKIFTQYTQEIPSIQAVTLRYYRGWEETPEDLYVQLERIAPQERGAGYSLIGPHRAEIYFKMPQGLCKDQLSRGRQKTLAIALYLAQGEILFHTTGQHPLYMIDDFSSELDTEAQTLLLHALHPENKQVIITLLDPYDKLFNPLTLSPNLFRQYTLCEGVLQ